MAQIVHCLYFLTICTRCVVWCGPFRHGDGRNRHFDKSVQIVVFRNGKAGLVGEHSMMDGMPVSAVSCVAEMPVSVLKKFQV